MSVERIIVRGDIDDYLDFGWEYTEDVRKRGGKGHHYNASVLSRDTSMPHYFEIVRLENEYFYLKGQLREYNPASPLVAIILFLLFIIPGIIYLAVKSNQKTRIAIHNSHIKRKMNDILYKVDEYFD